VDPLVGDLTPRLNSFGDETCLLLVIRTSCLLIFGDPSWYCSLILGSIVCFYLGLSTTLPAPDFEAYLDLTAGFGFSTISHITADDLFRLTSGRLNDS